MTGKDAYRVAAIIPCYNHGKMLGAVLRELAEAGISSLVVDDGSTPEEAELVRRAVRSRPGTRLLRLERNSGKGAAVIAGIRELRKLGFTHALQVDADGQHEVSDANRLIALSRAHPGDVVSGLPVYDSSAPKGRLAGRRVTDFWVKLETLSSELEDSMCGFRVYPAEPFCAVVGRRRVGQRMDFDTEILVRLFWSGCRVRYVRTRVRYPKDGVSHFDYLRDNLRISAMHAKLFIESPLHWKRALEVRREKRIPRPGGWSMAPERGGTRWIRIMFAVYRKLGRKPFELLLVPVAAVFWLTGKAAREAVGDFDRTVVKAGARVTPGGAAAFRHFYRFGLSMLDRLAAWTGDYCLGRSLEFTPGSREALRYDPAKRGKLVLTSHLGTAEVCRAIAEREIRAPVAVLMDERNAAGFSAMLRELAPESRVDVIAVDDISIGTIERLSQHLDRGGWLAIAADRTGAGTERRADHSVSAPFLGRNARFPAGPYILASLLGCEVWTLFAIRDGSRFRVDCRELSRKIRLPRKGRAGELSRLAGIFASRLGEEAVAHPFEWFNFYPFWEDGKIDEEP